MEQSRDYAGTGAGTTSGNKLFVSAKKANWVLNKNPIGNQIVGYVDDMDIKFETGNMHEDGGVIPAHWSVQLLMSVRDEVNGVEDEQLQMKIAKYTVQFSQISRTNTHSVINALLATDMNWDGWLSLNIYAKQGTTDNFRLSVKTSKSQTPGVHAPTKFAFDSTSMSLIGVPRAEDKGYDDNGNKILGWNEVDNFWLIQAKLLYQKITGKAPAFPFWAKEPGKVYCVKPFKSFEPYAGSGAFEEGIRRSLGLPATISSPAAATNMASTPAPTATGDTLFWQSIDKKLAEIISADETGVTKANTLMGIAAQHKPPHVSMADVVLKIDARLLAQEVPFIFDAPSLMYVSGDLPF